MARPIDPEKRAAILQAAKMIIERDGYQSAKIAQIAAEAGVAAGTVYLYFDSKEAIAAALASEFFELASALTRKHAPQLTEPDGVENYIDAVVEFAIANKALLEQLKPNPKMAEDEYSKEKRRELQGQMISMLQDQMDKGIIDSYDPRGLASLIFGIMHSVVMGVVVFKDYPREIYRETAAKILRKALQPSASA